MAAPAKPPLQEAQTRFIRAWGDMGAAWGISRTMAEVHALLFITARPLNTDDVMDRLQISRGSASMSLRELVDWGLAERVHKPGDRKEYFAAEGDVWTIVRAVVRERLKREIEPLMVNLFEIRDMTGIEASRAGGRLSTENKQAVVEHNRRLDELLDFMRLVDKLSTRFVKPSGRGLRVAATMLNKVV